MLRVVIPPDQLISAKDAKAHLNVDTSDDDVLIGALCMASQQHLDGPAGWLGRCLGPQTLELSIDSFSGVDCSGIIRLPCPPVTEISSVKYVDPVGIERTVDPSDYRSVEGNLLVPSFNFRWPASRLDLGAVRITYVAGYTELPVPIRIAMLMLIAQWYGSREAGIQDAPQPLPFSVEALLTPYRIWSA